MRFSIRDLLWATLVVAMGLGWWISYRALDERRLEAVRRAQRFRADMLVVKDRIDHPIGYSDPEKGFVVFPIPDKFFDVLNEQPIEP